MTKVTGCGEAEGALLMVKGMRICLLVAGALSFVTASSAQAQSCGAIYSAQRQVEGAKAQLLLDYPGTAVTLLGCAANAADQPTDSQTSSFLGCSFIACLVIGLDVCAGLAGRIIDVARAEEQVKDAIRRNGC